jgi:hypothetical protein
MSASFNQETKSMEHYKLIFLDRDDVYLDAEDMVAAMEQVPNQTLIGCEEIDDNGKTLGGIYQQPRNYEETVQLMNGVILELRMLPKDSPHREFLRGKLYGLQMALFADWECINAYDDRFYEKYTIEVPEDKYLDLLVDRGPKQMIRILRKA